MSANTSSVPCFSLYNLDLQRNVRYTQPLSTTPSDGTDKMYLHMTLLGAAIALNQCTPSTTQETEQRLPLSLDTGDRQFTTLNTLFISYSNIPRCTQWQEEKNSLWVIPFLFQGKLEHLYPSHKVMHQVLVAISFSLKERYLCLHAEEQSTNQA